MVTDRQPNDRAAIDSSAAVVKVPLLSRVTCPHCWHQYPPEESTWISSDHKDLRGDPKLSADHPRRFKAERFDVKGTAIDARNQLAQGLACPNCHLEAPRALYEYQPFFVSIIGAPGSGKSFFLPAQTWFLRSLLPQKLAISFQDADPRFNIRLHEYEETLFLNADRETPVTLAKTEVQKVENLYDEVRLGNDYVELPRPFVFRMEPTMGNPSRAKIASISRAVCMYDNAGESFLAAASNKESRVTNHLQRCDLTLFMFDATQHPRFREAAKGVSSDPQWTKPLAKVALQNTLLDNAAARLRKLRGLALQESFDGPLVVVLTKLDAWVELIPHEVRNRLLATQLFLKREGDQLCRLSIDSVQTLSRVSRALLQHLAPEIVAAAEAFSTNVTYIPVSATGRAVREVAPGQFGVRPSQIQPKWCELPLLTGMAMAKVPLIRTTMNSA